MTDEIKSMLVANALKDLFAIFLMYGIDVKNIQQKELQMYIAIYQAGANAMYQEQKPKDMLSETEEPIPF